MVAPTGVNRNSDCYQSQLKEVSYLFVNEGLCRRNLQISVACMNENIVLTSTLHEITVFLLKYCLYADSRSR